MKSISLKISVDNAVSNDPKLLKPIISSLDDRTIMIDLPNNQEVVEGMIGVITMIMIDQPNSREVVEGMIEEMIEVMIEVVREVVSNHKDEEVLLLNVVAIETTS